MHTNLNLKIKTTHKRILLAALLHLVIPFLFFIPMMYFGFTMTTFIVSYLVSRWIAGQINNAFLPEFCYANNYMLDLKQKEEK